MTKQPQAVSPQNEADAIEATHQRQQIDQFLQAQLRDSKRIRFIIFRQQRCYIARSILAGTVQIMSIKGLNHDKMAFDDLETQLKQEKLVVGNQTFSTGRRIQADKSEYLLLENSANTDVDHCVVVNIEKTQMYIGFNITSSTVVNYEGEATRIVKEATPLYKIALVQPPPPQPTPLFDFDDEQLKNSPLFIFNGMFLERANLHPVDANKAQNICLVTVNSQHLHFEWTIQQLYAMQKKFDNLALFVMISELNPHNLQQVCQLCPYLPRLNLVYDSLGQKRTFFGYLSEGKAKKYQQIQITDYIDDLYVRLQDLNNGDRAVEEDNELVVNPDGSGIIFMGIPLNFHNPDIINQPEEVVEKTEEKKYKRLKENAISAELYEKEEDENEKQNEPEAPMEGDAKDNEDAGEKQKDPLNTYVIAFWNPRHKDFQAKINEFLALANEDNIKELNSEQPRALNENGEPIAEEFKPYIKLYSCIQGSRQINIAAYEKKIPEIREQSKIILDNDWLFQKLQVIFNQHLTARDDQINDHNDVGFFYIYNRQFKNIFEGEDFNEMATLAKQRGIIRKSKTLTDTQ